MKRRSFLLSGAALLCARPTFVTAQVPFFNTRVTCVVITDVTAESSIPHVVALFDALVEKGVPFTCLVDPYAANGKPLPPNHPLSQMLTAYAFLGERIEVATYANDLPQQKEYFQSRTVRDANQALRDVITGHRDTDVRQTLLRTVAHDEAPSPEEPTGVRSAGVSTVLSIPEHDAPVRSERWSNGVVRLFGGTRLDLAQYTTTDISAPPDVTQSLYYLSAKDVSMMTTDQLSKLCGAFADDLLGTELSGQNSLQRVSDVLLRDDFAFSRFLSVHLVRPHKDDAEAHNLITQFRNDLAEVGIRSSIGDLPSHMQAGTRQSYWLPMTAADREGGDPKPEDMLETVIHNLGSGFVRSSDQGSAPLTAGNPLRFVDLNSDAPGVNADGALGLPCLDVADAQIASQIGHYLKHTNDVVLSVRAEALKKPFVRQALKSDLLALASTGVTKIVPVVELGQFIAPRGAELSRHRKSTALAPYVNATHRKTTDTDRVALMEDAQIAWSYFEKHTINATGLCPATVNFSARDGRRHPTVTMWDVGSHINGLVAAAQLGLISRKRFDRNIAQILRQVRGRETQGRLLPQGWLRVDRQKWGNRDFDGSDAGRLLASLENLRRFAGLEDQLEALVGSWDLDQIIVDGEVNSVIDGDMVSAYRSHSAHYSARAFRYWGLDVRSPYEVTEGLSDYDAQMALIEAASWIGPIGAEPLLLEAMELGMSKESAYLAEVLYAAQFEEFQDTGRFIAVSEGPIDLEPWFTYQGLQLDAKKRTWALDTVGHDDRYMTPAFWEKHLVLSSKAAFLWNAYKPVEHSHRVLDEVRQTTRTRFGFASSTFDHNGRVTATYTDINTNAVILQSIAHMLVGT